MKLPTIRWRSLLIPAFLLGLTALLAGLTFGLARDFGRPNVLFLPDMVESVPYDAFDANPVFADGKTLRPPVAGTIARGHMPLRYGTGEEEALRAGRVLHNPFDATPAVLARGERVYASFCRPCHGEGGAGDGPVTTRGFPPPPALQGTSSMEMADGRIFHVITFGQGNMPAYAAQISVEDRWKVIHHVRRLQAPDAENGS